MGDIYVEERTRAGADNGSREEAGPHFLASTKIGDVKAFAGNHIRSVTEGGEHVGASKRTIH